ncbi:MAG TPA: PAAR domain-containing protein [Acidiphilium sp.]|nr:PAAR domain-containing protein [Acidiphilium sp.]
MAGEKPAARATDMHTCPDTDGPIPHVGGPIASGSPNVLIGGLPAARVTDPLTCVGPPDTIVMGSPTVLINGLPAARMGDQTAHGGVIVGGLPTVLIGTAGGASPVVDTALGMTVDDAAQALVMVQAAAVGKAFCAVCLGL